MKQAIGAIGGICVPVVASARVKKAPALARSAELPRVGSLARRLGIRAPERRSAGLLDSAPAYWLEISCRARKTVKRISNGRSTPIKPRFSASAGIWKHCGAKANTSCFV